MTQPITPPPPVPRPPRFHNPTTALPAGLTFRVAGAFASASAASAATFAGAGVSENNGSWTFSFTPTASGSYHATAGLGGAAVCMGTNCVQRCPSAAAAAPLYTATVDVPPAAAAAHTTVASGAGLSAATAGQPAEFSVLVKDACVLRLRPQAGCGCCYYYYYYYCCCCCCCCCVISVYFLC